MLRFVRYIDNAVSAADSCIWGIVEKTRLVDKMQVAMFVSWIWAFIGLRIAKAFELIFSMILKMPDSWLRCIPTRPIVNDHKERVVIRDATNQHGSITNKFKLFLRYYWESDQDGNKFSFPQLTRLLGCSMLYCSYLLTDSNGNIPPEQFYRNAHQFLISAKTAKPDQYTTRTGNNAPVDLPFGEVRFNGQRNQQSTDFDNLRRMLTAELSDMPEDLQLDPASEAGAM
jgi:hypothetical protein